MNPDDTVDAKYIGDFEVYSPGHDRNISPGDIVPMPEAEADARSDFEIVRPPKEAAARTGKGGDK